MGPDLERYMSRLPHLQVDRRRHTCQHVLTHVDRWPTFGHVLTYVQAPSRYSPSRDAFSVIELLHTGLNFGKRPGEQER